MKEIKMTYFPEIMTAKEAAQYLRLSYNEFLINCRKGKIPHFKATGENSRVLCRKSALEKWIEALEVGKPTEETKPKIRKIK